MCPGAAFVCTMILSCGACRLGREVYRRDASLPNWVGGAVSRGVGDVGGREPPTKLGRRAYKLEQEVTETRVLPDLVNSKCT